MPVFTLSNYWAPWLWASWPSPHLSFSFSKRVFQPSSFSFHFNGWTRIKKLSGTLRLSWPKTVESVQESCPCLLLQTTRRFTQKTLREKPQAACYELCLVRVKQACQCLILKKSQEDFFLSQMAKCYSLKTAFCCGILGGFMVTHTIIVSLA